MVDLPVKIAKDIPEAPCCPTAFGYRCPSHTSHPRHIPTVAIMIDGVLAKCSQFVIDSLCLAGKDGFRGTYDWRQLDRPLVPGIRCDTCPVNCRASRTSDPDMSMVLEVLKNRHWGWMDIEPFEDVDFEALHSAMAAGEFIGYFLAHRPFLNTPGSIVDPRYLTRSWLMKQNRGRFDSYGVVADLCKAKTVSFLKGAGIDYFLTQSIDQAIDARIEGIDAYVIDRPWNHDKHIPFRVSSVEEFLNQTVYLTADRYTNNQVDAR